MKRFIVTLFLLANLIVLQATNNPVLHLPFNSNIIDNSGNGYIITNNGAFLATDRFGNENSAIYFNGNSYIKINSSENLPNITTEGYTISLWVKQDITAKDDGDILSYGGYSKGGFGFGYKSGEYYSLKLYPESGISYTLCSIGQYQRMLEENWNMLTITYNNGMMKSYVNGCLVEVKEVEGFSPQEYDFVIGGNSGGSNNTTCWVDDVFIYDRTLNDNEVAELSDLSGAIRAVRLNAYSLSDFEQNGLAPVKYDYNWHVYGAEAGIHPDTLSYITITENPIKEGANTSDFVAASVTFPTSTQDDLTKEPSRKKEYVVYSETGDMYDCHHIMQWKFLIYDSTLLQVDNRLWMCYNQIHGGFQYFGSPCAGTGDIAYGGGIFNDNKQAGDDPLSYRFHYRAMPDSAKVYYTLDIGRWMTFTYDIFWTKSNTGYWRLYKDGVLLSSRDNVQTLPDCAPEGGGNQLQFKTGQYTRWNDSIDGEIDSLSVFFDDVELYINPEEDNINIYDICPECFKITSNENEKTDTQSDKNNILYPNPVKDILKIEGENIPKTIIIYTHDGRVVKHFENTKTANVSDLKQGIYIVAINVNDKLLTKKIIKE